jgi:AI-2 transport protein TqsA
MYRMNSPQEWSVIERSALFLALILIIIIGLKMIEFIFNLLLISLILTLMTIPAMDWLKKRGVPAPVAVMVVTALACIFVLSLILLTFYSFQVLLSDLPMYQTDLNQRLSDITALLGTYGLDASPASASSVKLMDIAPTLLSSMISISEALMYVFFIGVTTFFMLLEVPNITHRIEKMYAAQTEKFRQMSRMSGYIIDFIIVRTETNLVHGVLFGGILSVMGVHAALLWGILTFFLGYIPYLGLVAAALPAIFFAYLQFGIWGAAAVIFVVVVLNLIVENPVFSYLASRKFEMPALVVILSVIFWGWLLGIAGMLFAVPITLMALVFIQCCDDLRWLNELLGVSQLFDDGDKKPACRDGQE